jgi:hypothetical protein
MPNPRLLSLMMTFIFSTLFAVWARPLGVVPATIAGLFGAAVGWVGTRWLMRRLF